MINLQHTSIVFFLLQTKQSGRKFKYGMIKNFDRWLPSWFSISTKLKSRTPSGDSLKQHWKLYVPYITTSQVRAKLRNKITCLKFFSKSINYIVFLSALGLVMTSCPIFKLVYLYKPKKEKNYVFTQSVKCLCFITLVPLLVDILRPYIKHTSNWK